MRTSIIILLALLLSVSTTGYCQDVSSFLEKTKEVKGQKIATYDEGWGNRIIHGFVEIKDSTLIYDRLWKYAHDSVWFRFTRTTASIKDLEWALVVLLDASERYGEGYWNLKLETVGAKNTFTTRYYDDWGMDKSDESKELTIVCGSKQIGEALEKKLTIRPSY